MKEVKLLDRVQAVIHIYIILILATIQENGLKSELAGNYCFLILLKCNSQGIMNTVKV